MSQYFRGELTVFYAPRRTRVGDWTVSTIPGETVAFNDRDGRQVYVSPTDHDEAHDEAVAVFRRAIRRGDAALMHLGAVCSDGTFVPNTGEGD